MPNDTDTYRTSCATHRWMARIESSRVVACAVMRRTESWIWDPDASCECDSPAYHLPMSDHDPGAETDSHMFTLFESAPGSNISGLFQATSLVTNSYTLRLTATVSRLWKFRFRSSIRSAMSLGTSIRSRERFTVVFALTDHDWKKSPGRYGARSSRV